jgi:hypothetical protein
MNFFKIILTILIVAIFSFMSAVAEQIDCAQYEVSNPKYLECIEKNKNEQLKSNIESIDEEIPLINPFARDTSVGLIAPDDTINNEYKIQAEKPEESSKPLITGQSEIKKYKLSGVLIGNDEQYASFVDPSGNYINLAINELLGENLKLVIIKKDEVRFISTEGEIISLDFNNRIEIQ